MTMMAMMHTIALTMAMMIYCMNQNVAYVLSSLLAVLVTILNSITFYSAGTHFLVLSFPGRGSRRRRFACREADMKLK